MLLMKAPSPISFLFLFLQQIVMIGILSYQFYSTFGTFLFLARNTPFMAGLVIALWAKTIARRPQPIAVIHQTYLPSGRYFTILEFLKYQFTVRLLSNLTMTLQLLLFFGITFLKPVYLSANIF